MNERLAVDSNAVIAWLRSEGVEPAGFREAKQIVLPLPVVGELYAGLCLAEKRLASHRDGELPLGPRDPQTR